MFAVVHRKLRGDPDKIGDTFIKPETVSDSALIFTPKPNMFPRLLILFIGIPLIELILFMQIGSRIGIPATIATIVLTGIIGASLTRRQGLQVFTRYQKALAEGRMPHEEVIEGLMILVAGAVLLTPGFLTDAIGFALLVPTVRAAVRGLAAKYLKGKVEVRVANAGVEFPGTNPTSTVQGGDASRKRPPLNSPVIDVEAEVEESTSDRH